MVRGVDKFKEYFRDYTGQVKQDAEMFLDRVREKPIDVKSLNIRNVSYDELLEVMVSCYGLE